MAGPTGAEAQGDAAAKPGILAGASGSPHERRAGGREEDMAYSQGRIVHDADAHIMETPTWLRDHAEAADRDQLPVLRYPGGNELRQTGVPAEQQRDLIASCEALRARHASSEYRANEAAEIMARKNCAATGSFIAEDRGRALDLLGFSSQLVFNTFHNRRLHDWEHSGDLDLA